MPAVDFPFELKIDGQSYRGRRLDGSRSYSSTFIPQVAGQRAEVQLDPLNESDWGDGRGWGQNVDNSEGMMLPGPLVTSVSLPSQPGADLEQFAEQDGHIYVVGGRYAYRIPNGSDAPVQEQDLGASFVAVSVEPFKTALYVGGRSTGNIWQKTAGGAWSNTMAGAAVQRGKLATVYWEANSPTLVGEQGTTGTSYVAANPLLDTDWTPRPNPIDLGSYPVRSIVHTRDHVYFGTTGGLLDLDLTGAAPNLIPEAERLLMDTNGRATLAASGWIYYNAGYTLKRVRVVGQEYGGVQDCGWAAQLPPQCPMSGYCTALVKVDRWIWAAIYDGTNTWVCKAREAVQGFDRVGPLVWFVAPIYLANLKVTSMHVSGLVSQNPRLWMAIYDGSSRALRWAPLPLDSAYRDLRNSRPYRFATGFTYDHPDEDHGDDSLPKYLREIVGEGENLGSGTQDTLSVAADGSSAFSQVGILRSNPRATISLPSATTIMAGRYILRHTGTGTTTAPPILRKLSRRVIPRPDLLEVRSYQLVVGPAVRTSGGAVEGRSRKVVRRAIARLQKVLPVSFSDEDHGTLTVLVAPGANLTELEANLGDGQARRMLVVDVQLAVLATFGAAASAIYNDGTIYDSEGRVYA